VEKKLRTEGWELLPSGTQVNYPTPIEDTKVTRVPSSGNGQDRRAKAGAFHFERLRISAALFEPTVLANPAPEAKVSRLEVFGPVLSVFPYRDMDEAITRANDLPFAFQAAIFTRDIDTAMRAYS